MNSDYTYTWTSMNSDYTYTWTSMNQTILTHGLV